MKIVKLEAQDFKRLRAVTINPDGSVVTIGGNNGQGKSSTLDAIAAALGGEKLCPKEPIRRGTNEAVIRLEMDEDLVVERKFRRADDGAITSTLKVTRKDGLKLSKPQQNVLDPLVGKLAFDPLAFLREHPRKQADIVRELAGVDTSPLDLQRQQAYDQRTEVGRDLTRMKGQLSGMWQPVDGEDVPAEEQSAGDLMEEQQRRQAEFNQNEKVRHAYRVAGADYKQGVLDVQAAEEKVKEFETALGYAREKVAQEKTALERIVADGKKLKEQVAELVDPDLDEVPKQMRALDDTNRKVRAGKERQALVEKVAATEANVVALTRAIDQADEAKRELIAKAKLPVPGLSFSTEGLLMNGLPFEQASQAEQLRLSMAVAIALNPKMPIALIRDASLLDATSLAVVAKMATDAGAQVWLEVVGAAAGAVVIEDGEVAGA